MERKGSKVRRFAHESSSPVCSLVVALGQTLLMACMAEFVGLWPTAGGQQYFVQVLANPRYRRLGSYLVGWFLMMAEMSIGSSGALNNANIITSFVSLLYPDVVWKVRR